ncbi:hypothetical protein DL766_005801 [Monosporascus sp. MC13-8B]|uniref:N-acetyltransferase domain-containing protein n=1 Tax=Monosporascus cannonballus TaxID=155416 RepID=A0ABY0HK14_9PEZI|nr:hypothetical protein DL763_006938 [Monosporascus cannonballus]RYO94901.1 hypothetical protein DL762_000335 [Monosporascus cannonballus]RYP28578.1 hypothetical protein DL766_005801 [Monosporascus sp. MC13-8B]
MIPVLDTTHNSPPGFAVREASLGDVKDLTRLWYSAFNTSHKFWEVMTPADAVTCQWWNDVWTMGIKAGPAVLKTFVVEDLSRAGRLVAFSRWHLPQADGSQNIPLPEYPPEWDPELTEALWGGMPKNRADVMGQRPHWMLEFLGVDREYQQKGLGFTLVDWGCRQADSQGLEVYLDASPKGLPFYKRNFGFEEKKVLQIPLRPETFGSYELMTVVRSPKAWSFSDTVDKQLSSHVGVEVVEVEEA